MRPLNVLFLTGEYPPMAGGIADYTRLLRNALAPQRVSSLVLSVSDTHADATIDRWNWRIASTIRNMVAEQAVDMLHIQYQAGAFDMHPAVNMLPKMFTDVPVVTTFHDLRPPYLFPKAGRLRFALMRRMARWSHAAVVTNPGDAATLRESRIGVREISLGPSLPPPDSGASPTRTVGFFGFPSRQKGFDTLLEAMGNISADMRPSLTVIGGSPPESGTHGFLSRSGIESLSEGAGVRIDWAGYLSAQDASNALARCRAIVLPFPAGASLRSSALIAVLQAGRPVVTTEPHIRNGLGDLDSLPQLVTVPAKDPIALRRAIEQAMRWSEVGQPLPERFGWESIAKQHRALYDTVLEGHSV